MAETDLNGGRPVEIAWDECERAWFVVDRATRLVVAGPYRTATEAARVVDVAGQERIKNKLHRVLP